MFAENMTKPRRNDGYDFVCGLIIFSSSWNAASTTSPAPTSPALTSHASTMKEANVTLSVAPLTSTHHSSNPPTSQRLGSTTPAGNVCSYRWRSPVQCCRQLAFTTGRNSLLCSVSTWWRHLWSSPSTAANETTVSLTTTTTPTTPTTPTTSMAPNKTPAINSPTNATSDGWSGLSWYLQHKSVWLNTTSFFMLPDLSVSEILTLLFTLSFISFERVVQPPRSLLQLHSVSTSYRFSHRN